MRPEIFNHDVQHALELVGIFAFAISGGLLAVRKNFDVFGILVLAETTALGGGVLRDVVVNAGPPAAFRDNSYLLTPLVAAVVVILLHPEVVRINRFVLLFDAAGLGLFCVTGTVTAATHGMALVPSAVLGVASAAGGGVLRDLLAQETPTLLRWDREIYAVPAIVGAGLTALLIHLHHLGSLTALGCAVVAFAIRVLALRFGWRAPRAWHRSGRSLPGLH